jgi:predicted ester cyclase
MIEESPRKSRLRRFLREVWDEGRAEAADAYVAPSYAVAHDPGDPWDGRTLDLDGFKDRVRRSRAPCPDQAFLIEQLVEDGDTVVATWRWTATHLGEIAGFPPTGKTLTMSGATAYRFDDADRLISHWQIVDRLGLFQQLQRNRGGRA